MNGIGKNIKKLRKERALSQEQLAERLHVTRQAPAGRQVRISRILRRWNPLPRYLTRIF